MTREADAVAVVRQLSVPPRAIDVVIAQRDLPPREPGFYAWWALGGAIADVPHLPHPLEQGFGLFYVGISPKRPTSKQNINTRVRHHIAGNTGSSTFRYVLAALLLDELELVPLARGDKVVLDRDDNRDLSQWQRNKLRLTWCIRSRPWEIEEDVIALMQPPLNCAANASHPFYPRVRAARDEFRRRAE
jgi:hypothetical protein